MNKKSSDSSDDGKTIKRSSVSLIKRAPHRLRSFQKAVKATVPVGDEVAVINPVVDSVESERKSLKTDAQEKGASANVLSSLEKELTVKALKKPKKSKKKPSVDAEVVGESEVLPLDDHLFDDRAILESFNRVIDHEPPADLVRGSELCPTVFQDNRLINASYKLPINQKRLILAAIAKAGNEEIKDDRFYRLTRKDLIDSGVPSGSVRAVMRDALNGTLYNSSVDVELPPTVPGGNKQIARLRWIQSVVYNEDENYVDINFGRLVSKLISGLNREYTTYKVSSVRGLKSVAAIRIFEMLSQFKNGGHQIISIEEFLHRLQIETKYSPSELRKRLLDPAVKQINETTNFVLTYTLKGQLGRKLDTIFFLWYAKGQQIEQDAESYVQLTKKQAVYFAMLLHAMPAFQSEWGRGRLERWDSLLNELIEALMDPHQSHYFLPWLKKVGFDPNFAKKKKSKRRNGKEEVRETENPILDGFDVDPKTLGS